MNARDFLYKVLKTKVDVTPEATVEVRYRVGGETLQFPVSAVFALESAGGQKIVLVIEAATTR